MRDSESGCRRIRSKDRLTTEEETYVAEAEGLSSKEDGLLRAL